MGVGGTSHRQSIPEVAILRHKIDSSGTTSQIILKANNRCKEVAEQRVLMYSLVARGSAEQRVRKAAVKKKRKRNSMKMTVGFRIVICI